VEPKPLDATNEMRVKLKDLELKACGSGREVQFWRAMLRPYFSKVERQIDVLDAEWFRMSKAILGLTELRKQQDVILANLRLAVAQLVLAQGGRVVLSKGQRINLDPETVIEVNELEDGSIELKVTIPAPEPEKAMLRSIPDSASEVH